MKLTKGMESLRNEASDFGVGDKGGLIGEWIGLFGETSQPPAEESKWIFLLIGLFSDKEIAVLKISSLLLSGWRGVPVEDEILNKVKQF